MKRLLLLPPVLLALTLTACADAPSGPSDTALTPTAPSFAVTQNAWSDVSVDWYHTCGPTPEMVSLQGRYHQVVKQQGDKLQVMVNFSGLKGVGQTTGNTYVAQQFQHFFLVPFPSPSYSETLDIREQMISKGSADNFFVVYHAIFTYPTFEFTENSLTIDCKG